MLKKLIAILFIYCCTVIAWTILGSTLLIRSTGKLDWEGIFARKELGAR